MTVRVILLLPDDQHAVQDKTIHQRGTTQAELIRKALTIYLVAACRCRLLKAAACASPQ